MSEEVYLAYFRGQRRWLAQKERDTYNGVVSYDAMDTEDMLGEGTIPDVDTPKVEDTVVDKLLREKLYRCLAQLPKSEQDVLYALYFDGLSERQAGVKFGSHYMTIHNRKVKLLQQLKKMMEK